LAVTRRGGPRPGPGLQEVIVIALAAERVARAISIDEVSAGWRKRIQNRAQAASGSSSRAQRWAADMIGCPVCTGWWSSLALSLLWPGRFRVRRGLAVAGAQVILTFAERLVSEQGRLVIQQAEDADD
jgi:hypothetical protein